MKEVIIMYHSLARTTIYISKLTRELKKYIFSFRLIYLFSLVEPDASVNENINYSNTYLNIHSIFPLLRRKLLLTVNRHIIYSSIYFLCYFHSLNPLTVCS